MAIKPMYNTVDGLEVRTTVLSTHTHMHRRLIFARQTCTGGCFCLVGIMIDSDLEGNHLLDISFFYSLIPEERLSDLQCYQQKNCCIKIGCRSKTNPGMTRAIPKHFCYKRTDMLLFCPTFQVLKGDYL